MEKRKWKRRKKKKKMLLLMLRGPRSSRKRFSTVAFIYFKTRERNSRCFHDFTERESPDLAILS